MEISPRVRQYVSDGLNGLATIIASGSTVLAAASPQPAAAAFPAVVTSITASGLYRPKLDFDLHLKTARLGLAGSIFAKGAIALASVIQSVGCGQYELIPSVAVPLGLSAGADANTYHAMNKLENILK